jgi:hypothetical protein
MACNTLTTISGTCGNNAGGISELYLWDMDDNVATASTFSTTTFTWTAYDITAGTTGSNPPIAYIFNDKASNFTEETVVSLENGSTYNTQTVNLVFNRRSAAKSASIHLMGEGQRKLGALIKDANDTYWLIEDLQLTATGEGSGTVKGDGSKYTVTLTAENIYLAGVVGASGAASLISTGTFT